MTQTPKHTLWGGIGSLAGTAVGTTHSTAVQWLSHHPGMPLRGSVLTSLQSTVLIKLGLTTGLSQSEVSGEYLQSSKLLTFGDRTRTGILMLIHCTN